jgi:hypothetical protein
MGLPIRLFGLPGFLLDDLSELPDCFTVLVDLHAAGTEFVGAENQLFETRNHYSDVKRMHGQRTFERIFKMAKHLTASAIEVVGRLSIYW